MDSLYLLDRAEDAVAAAPGLPFTRYALVDRGELLALFDQVRTAAPTDPEQSGRAQDAGSAAGSHTDLAGARRRPDAIVRDAEEEASTIIAEADAWAARRLQRVADELDRALRAGAALGDDLHRAIGDLRRDEAPGPATVHPRPSRLSLGALVRRAHGALTP